MRVFRHLESPMRAADAASFVGPASTKLIGSSGEGPPVNAYRVEFDAGARTHWHTHSGPQWLFVIGGRIRVQVWGSSPVDLAEGDTVLVAPLEKHWHGAAPGSRGSHLAVNVNAKTDWLEPVTDEEYAAAG